jgi:hypothetical protein
MTILVRIDPPIPNTMCIIIIICTHHINVKLKALLKIFKNESNQHDRGRGYYKKDSQTPGFMAG